MTQELINLLNENFECNMAHVHTAFPAVVKEYVPETRRAKVQPSLKRKLPSGEFVELPIIVDVPVIFPGTKKCGLHFPLNPDDEVLLLVSERCIDNWKDTGQDQIEDMDIRRFSLPDAVALPGLQAVEFCNIRDGLGSMEIHDDDRLTLTTNDDGTFFFTNGTTKITIEHENLTYENGDSVLEIKGKKFSFRNDKNNIIADGEMSFTDSATNLIKIGNSVATLGSLLSSICDRMSGLTMNSGDMTSWGSQLQISALKQQIQQVFRT